MTAVLTLALSAATADAGTRRFALIAGSNHGGGERVALRYATDDARAIAHVLEQIGGVSPEDSLVLDDPDRTDIAAAISDLSARISAAEGRTELVFYYSGHSDDQGLLPEGTLYPYPDLRADIDAVPVDLKLVVLDSCASGAMVRRKGGVMQPPFLVDASVDVTGHAYLTSASESEAAQESDRIGGSFFTHYLVSGMRGAADVSGDGQVTLNEAYNFARDETLARTQRTQAGPQHALWDIQFAGAGDLVVTDLRGHGAGLVVDPGLEGRLFVHDDADRLVAELHKNDDRSVELRLDPGAYRVVWVQDDRSREADFQVAADQRVRVAELSFRSIVPELALLKGGASDDAAYEVVPIHIGVLPALGYGGGGHGTLQKMAISVGIVGASKVEGMQLALGGSIAYEDLHGAQLSVGFNQAGRADAEMEGLQASVGANVAGGTLRGSQVAVGANVSGQVLRGVQVAVGANIARDVHGTQLSVSGVNVADTVHGAQIAVVNVADEANFQLGLVNVAQDADVAIGLVSINGGGYNHLQVYGADSHLLNLGLTYGGKRFYNVIQAGGTPGGRGGLAALGVGLHNPVGQIAHVDVDVDVAAGLYAARLSRGADGFLLRGRLLAGVKFAKHLGVFAGPTFTAIPHAWSGRRMALDLGGRSVGAGDSWVGGVVGIRI